MAQLQENPKKIWARHMLIECDAWCTGLANRRCD